MRNRPAYAVLRSTVIASVLAMTVAALPPRVLRAQLRVRAAATSGAWHTWWHPVNAPAVWRSADATLTRAVRWQQASPGVELGDVMVSGAGEAWRTRVVLVRLDPARVTLRLDAQVSDDGALQPWTINATPDARDAVVALNAGQFGDAGPWGWIVHDGREVQAPGTGALAGAVVVRTDGAVQIVDADSVAGVRGSAARDSIAEALQSYPTLLTTGGRVPRALRSDGEARRIDLAHRDARLALGELRDGRLLIALTRFDGFGSRFGRVPFGLTVPEMSALMGGLGAHRALMLDGGISAQLAVKDGVRGRQEWAGLRRVPLGLVVTARAAR